MSIRIALAGNPNAGKTTLFNALTGANQYVGNWPGVTVEKKEGKLKKHSDVTITDLPGIYSLSPYTLEEVVARNYLIGEHPDAILNIVDGTNLERNLYLTTQLLEVGIPVVVAINMMDVVKKNGDEINVKELSRELGCPVIEISALKGTGIQEATDAAIKAAEEKPSIPAHTFCGPVEHAIAHIEDAALSDLPEEQKRWYAIKLFERDAQAIAGLGIDDATMDIIEKDIQAAETEEDDDAESIITNERYLYIASIIKGSYKKKKEGGMSTSDKIDRIVTNRWAALPIFAVVMFVVYYISMSTIGGVCTDWVNDGVFGDGWYLFGNGRSAYEEAATAYSDADNLIAYFEEEATAEGVDPSALDKATISVLSEDDGSVESTYVATQSDYVKAQAVVAQGEPDNADYGIWVPGIPGLVSNALEKANAADWLQGLIVDGIIAGVGAVLGFLPQMAVLFLFLAFLEGCGYMARIAFIMDRIFRKFGLSGKSFIPMLVGTGCGVPGIMASRTIENERDRRMTVMTTTFIPCSAKMPIVALIAGAVFHNSAWVATSAYFVGVAAIIISGIMLKKTKMFAGDPAPFVMELPAYHLPTVGSVLRSVWERVWSFTKKAGTIILLATILVWFLSSFGVSDGHFGMIDMDHSILAVVGNAVAWIFAPLGFGNWRAAVAVVTGLIAKENVVGTFGVLYGGFDEVAESGWQVWNNVAAAFSAPAAYSFLVFNLLCAPCFAAIGAMKREMNNAKWTWFAVGYQCGFAYLCSLMIYQFASALTGNLNVVGLIAAIAALALIIYMLVRPYKESNTLDASKVRAVDSKK